MSRGMWVFQPSKKKAPRPTEILKTSVKARADKLVEDVLKPRFIEPPPKNNDWNYVIDIFTKWHGNYFYFCSRYACPGPNASVPEFERKMARLEYAGGDRFNLALMRHNGKWAEVGFDMSLDECLDDIENSGMFIP